MDRFQDWMLGFLKFWGTVIFACFGSGLAMMPLAGMAAASGGGKPF